LVTDYEQGTLSVKQMSVFYHFQARVLYDWIYKFSTLNDKGCRIIEMKDSAEKKLKDQQKKIAELEQLLGRKQIQIEFMEKMIELAKEEHGIDLKKNYSTQPSTGSGSIKKK